MQGENLRLSKKLQQRIPKTNPSTYAMARNKSKSQSAGTSTAVQKPKAVLPKDKEEEELEKLVFGDAEGFREALKVSVEGLNEDESEAEARTRELTEEENLEGVGDDEVCVWRGGMSQWQVVDLK